MTKNEKNEKNKKKAGKEVYLLRSTYKDNDPDTIGAYDSMRAMMRGFAKVIADEVLRDSCVDFDEVLRDNVGVNFYKAALRLAVTLADRIPAFFDHQYPRDEEGCIRYGKTTFEYDVIPLESVDENEEAEKEQEA